MRIGGPIAAATLLIALNACSGDDDDSAETDFCEEALAFMDDGKAFNDPTSEAARDALDEVANLEPPDAIDDDWNALLDGARALRDTDPEDSGDLPAEVEDMGASAASVFRYLDNDCGLDISGEPPP